MPDFRVQCVVTHIVSASLSLSLSLLLVSSHGFLAIFMCVCPYVYHSLLQTCTRLLSYFFAHEETTCTYEAQYRNSQVGLGLGISSLVSVYYILN